MVTRIMSMAPWGYRLLAAAILGIGIGAGIGTMITVGLAYVTPAHLDRAPAKAFRTSQPDGAP